MHQLFRPHGQAEVGGGLLAGRRRQEIVRLVLSLLAALLVVQLTLLGLAQLAARTVYPLGREADVALALAVHQHSTPALTTLFLALTAVGTGYGSVAIVVAASLFLLRRGASERAASLVLVMLGAWELEFVTKHVVGRARPELFRLADATGYSFPSGHALLATCLYGTIGYALWRLSRRRWQRIATLVCAVAMPLGIGLSRVYLGVHYPSDVLGGWAVGVLWLTAAHLTLTRWSRRARRD